MEQWRKKSSPNVVVEAVRLNEENVEELAGWSRGDLIEEIDPEHPEEMQYGINLNTPSGMKRASLGMYLVKYANQFFVSHNRVFETSYEPVNREAPPLESAGDSRKARGFADPFDSGKAGF